MIERKYLDMLAAAGQGRRRRTPALEPLPGWLARRRKNASAGREILAEVPAGPVLPVARRRPRPDDHRGPAPAASIRSSPRSATATPSATKCSASSATLEAAGYESSIFVETADPRLEDLTLDYRDMVGRDHA